MKHHSRSHSDFSTCEAWTSTLGTLRCASCAIVMLVLATTRPAPGATFDLSTATIADIEAAMDSGALTSEKLVQLHLARIAAYDQAGPKLNTILTLNKNALAEARALDAERKAKGPRSPLHGIVVMPKDVYDTKDLPTSGGFKPMATSQPRYDSFVIGRLRAAGAIILAKLNQSDWYGVGPGHGSTLGGQPISAYNMDKATGGSSSGTGVAMSAWFGTVGLGSDTSGSIVIPTAMNNLVGISATHGLVSRTGMMWSSPRQENGGPMGRSVYDVAVVLDVIAGYDAADLATEACIGKLPDRLYTSFIDAEGLAGARIGVLREMIRSGGAHVEGRALAEAAFADMKKSGAILVDPVLTGLNFPQALDDAGAATYERYFAINKYLAALPAGAPIRTVEEMIAKGGDLTKPAIVESAKDPIPLERNPALIAAYKQQTMLRETLIALMDKYRLDVIALPYKTMIAEPRPKGNGRNNPLDARNPLASYTGLPTIIVPGGFFPSDGMPIGMQFVGRPFSEPTLIKVASGYEAKTRHRKAPASTPALPGESFEFSLPSNNS